MLQRMPPDDLGPIAKQFWLEHMGVVSGLDVVDLAAFRMMAEVYAVAIDAIKTMAKQDNGAATQVFIDAAVVFREYAVEFGMTPRARASMSDDAGELADLFFQDDD